MRVVPHAAFALLALVFALVCLSCSASTAASSEAPCAVGQHPLSVGCAWDPVKIAIEPGAGASGCPVFSPTPASAHENQLVQWTNDTSATVTVYQYEGTNTGTAPKALATIGAGQTSAGEFWGSAGDVTVFVDGW